MFFERRHEMKRLNPKTKKPFEYGFIREDGKYFTGYQKKIKKNGTFYEQWSTINQNDRSKTYYETIEGRTRAIMRRAKSRAKAKGLEFNLNFTTVQKIIKKGFCELTNLPFDMSSVEETQYNPYSPSLDRIDSTKGYTPKNVRVVLSSVNTSLGQYGEQQMLPILEAMVKGIKKNVKAKSTSSISAGHSGESEIYPELGAISCPRFGKNSCDAFNYSGAVQEQNTNYSTQASSGDSVGRGSKEVGPLKAPQSVKDNGQPKPKINSIKFGGRHLFS
jgi:hypothetical protein